MNIRLRTVLALFAFLPLAITTPADWPQFRGPGSLGVSSDTGLPAKWDATPNIIWKVALPGPGSSNPITFGDKIYVTCYSGYGIDPKNPGDQNNLMLHLVCLNRADGKTVWDKSCKANTPVQNFQRFVKLHGYASSTPAADADGIYCFFGRTGASAWSHDGKQLWTKSLGSKSHIFGTANSPVLFKDLVIFNASVEGAGLIALNKKTGDEVWRKGGMKLSWNTPALVDVNNGHELVVNTKGWLKAYDPQSGKPLWQSGGINDYICPSVISNGGVVYAIGGRKNTCLAIKAGGKGNVTSTNKLWELLKGSNVSSPVFHEGHLYWTHDGRGITYCVNAKTGELVFEQRLQPKPDRFYAAPTVADGKIYFTSRLSGTYVIAAKPNFQLLSHNRIANDRSIFNASPVISNSQILLRSNKFLYCIGK